VEKDTTAGCMSGKRSKCLATKKMDTGRQWLEWSLDYWSCLIEVGQRMVEKVCSSCHWPCN